MHNDERIFGIGPAKCKILWGISKGDKISLLGNNVIMHNTLHRLCSIIIYCILSISKIINHKTSTDNYLRGHTNHNIFMVWINTRFKCGV